MKIIILLFLTACTSVNWKTYTDEAYHFKINYPEKWSKQQKIGAVGFLSPREGESDLFQENMGLVLQDLTEQPMNLEQYTALTKKQIVDNFGASAIISLKNTTLAEQQATEFIFNMVIQGKNLKVKQYWFIKGKLVYLFSFTADPLQFEKYESIAMEMIQSFKFL